MPFDVIYLPRGLTAQEAEGFVREFSIDHASLGTERVPVRINRLDDLEPFLRRWKVLRDGDVLDTERVRLAILAKGQWVLCRCRHNLHNADIRIMPSKAGKDLKCSGC